MISPWSPLLLATMFAGQAAPARPSAAPADLAAYRAVLTCPGGELPFKLELSEDDGPPRAWIVNGPERIEVPKVVRRTGILVLDFEHYDALIDAVFELPAGSTEVGLRGTYRRRVSKDKWASLDFVAEPWRGHRFEPLAGDAVGWRPSVAGRWSIKFNRSESPSVGQFEQSSNGQVIGTILNSGGDYRYLEGVYQGGRLRLSCFDGAFAFLFDATMQKDGSLSGDFWSRDASHDRWTARRDDSAALPDGFSLTSIRPSKLADLTFPDLDGRPRNLAEPAFAGRAMIIEVFGSWCPNCRDASALLRDLDRKYRDRGLRIVGLAFELTGDAERDARQVRRYVRTLGIEYPVLMGGVADKETASEALPMLDRLRAYPTTIFLRRDGTVRAVHTGFAGPATGEEHQRLRKRFEGVIEELLR